MLYPFMTLDDNTEIARSEMKEDGRVKVYLERPDAEDDFHHATCWFPGYIWEDISDFSTNDIACFQKLICSATIPIY